MIRSHAQIIDPGKPMVGQRTRPNREKGGNWETLSDLQRAEIDLRSGIIFALTPNAARFCNLASWAYVTSGIGSDIRNECALDFQLAGEKVVRVSCLLKDILDLWRAVGIKATLFGGFTISQLAYPHPALGDIEDIDVHVSEGQLSECATTLPAGWHFEGSLNREPQLFGTIHSRSRELCIKVHRSLVPMSYCAPSVAQRITQQALRMRQDVEINGSASRGSLKCSTLSYLDLPIIGIALQRGWGEEEWQFRTHDYLGLRYLHERCGITERALQTRAVELGLSRTWNRFSRSCNFAGGQIDFRTPISSLWFRKSNDLIAMTETGKIRLPFRASRLNRARSSVLPCEEKHSEGFGKQPWVQSMRSVGARKIFR